MKKIIFLGLVIILTVYAEENPFSLAENFQKIDKAQDELLSSFKNIDEHKINRKTSKHVPTIIKYSSHKKVMQATKDINLVAVQYTSKVNIDKKLKVAKAKEIVKKKAQEAKEKAKEAYKIQEEKKAKVARAKKKRQEHVEAMRIKQLAKARRENARKEEQKKMAREIAAKEKELQAFEKKRLKKVAEEERKRVEQKRKKAALLKQQAKKELVQQKVKQKHKVNTVADINLEEEVSAEKKAIDQAYLDAIKEVE